MPCPWGSGTAIGRCPMRTPSSLTLVGGSVVFMKNVKTVSSVDSLSSFDSLAATSEALIVASAA